MSEEQNSVGNFIDSKKKCIYQLTHQLVHNQFNTKIYCILILLQHLQILAFQFHSKIQYNSQGIETFRSLTNFLNPEYYLRTTKLMDYFIPFCFVIGLIHVGALLYVYQQQVKQNRSRQSAQHNKKPFLTFCHYMTIFISTIFTLPVLLTSMLVFYCHSQSPYHQGRQCYETYHLFLILLSLLNMAWIFATNIYFFLLYFTKNPFQFQNCLAYSSPLWNILKFFIKVVLVGYLIFDQNLEFQVLFVFGVTAGFLGYTGITRILYPYTRYDNQVENTMTYIEMVSITMSLLPVLMMFFTQSQGIQISFLVSFFIGIPVGNVVNNFSRKKKQKMLLKLNDFEKDNSQTIEQILTYLIVYLQSKQKNDQAIPKIFKVIKFHNDECQDIQCQCHQFLQSFQKNDKFYSNKEMIYRIFIRIIEKVCQNNKKAYSLILIKCFIHYFKLRNSVKGAFLLSRLMKEKISFFDQYIITGLLYQLCKSIQNFGDMQQYIKFSQGLIQFESDCLKLAKIYSQYWHQLIQQNSSLLKIQKLILQAKKTHKNIQFGYKYLLQIFPSNIHVVEIYKELQKQVLINLDQYLRLNELEKQNKEIKQVNIGMGLKENFIKFVSNENLVVINSSVNNSSDTLKGGFEIINITSNVEKVIGYTCHELKGKNINRFLPKIYMDFHNQIVTSYLNKEDKDRKPRQISIFPVNSRGHIIESILIVKTVPSLDFGINIYSFMLQHPNPAQNLIIYDSRNGIIDSMSQKAEKLLVGRTKKGANISIPDHITDLLPVWDYLEEKVVPQKIHSSKQLSYSFRNLGLYRSDGPKDHKYVKILRFDVSYASRMFTLNEQQIQQQAPDIWQHINTLVDNSSQADIFKSYDNQIIYQCPEQSPVKSQNQQMDNQKFIEIKRNLISMQLFEPLSVLCQRSFIILQCLFALTMLFIIVFKYTTTLSYYDKFQYDVVSKQRIEQVQNDILNCSLGLSYHLFNGGHSIIRNEVNLEIQKSKAKGLIKQGEKIYEDILSLQENNRIQLSQLFMDVKYFQDSTIIIKQKIFTDTIYQFVLYVLQIYESQNPLNKVPNSVLFVFKNNLQLLEQIQNFNYIFTQMLIGNFNTKQSQVTIGVIWLSIFIFLCLLARVIEEFVIDQRKKNAILSYQTLPITQIEKFPKKCQKFIQKLSPSGQQIQNFTKTVKTIKDLGDIWRKKQQNKMNQDQKLIQEDEQIQYIKFNNHSEFFNILVKSACFLVMFIGTFFVLRNFAIEKGNQIKQSLVQWQDISQLRIQMSRLNYLAYHNKNFASQWNNTQLDEYEKLFNNARITVQKNLHANKKLNKQLDEAYRLITQTVQMQNESILHSIQEFLQNQKKIIQFVQNLKENQLKIIIEKDIVSKVQGHLSNLQIYMVLLFILVLIYIKVYLVQYFLK